QHALETAQSAINPTSKERDHHALHHCMALEFDRLADPNSAREPVTIGGSQTMAIAECTASFPDFLEHDVLCRVLREVPHGLLLSIASDEATQQVKKALDGLDLLVRLLSQHVATLERRQAWLGTKKSPRSADHARYVLILDLVRIFESTFGQPAAITREGACCRFLSAVVSRCEGKKLEPNGAYDSWREARRWLQTS